MNFQYFLNKYYLTSRLEELEKFLKKCGVHNDIKEIINDFYLEVKNENTDELHTRLVLTISDFTVTANLFLKDIADLNSKQNYQKEFIELGIYLIRETFIVSRYSKEKYFSSFGVFHLIINKVKSSQSLRGLPTRLQ